MQRNCDRNWKFLKQLAQRDNSATQKKDNILKTQPGSLSKWRQQKELKNNTYNNERHKHEYFSFFSKTQNHLIILHQNAAVLFRRSVVKEVLRDHLME